MGGDAHNYVSASVRSCAALRVSRDGKKKRYQTASTARTMREPAAGLAWVQKFIWLWLQKQRSGWVL